jgi:hypothetical protein
MTGTTEEKPPYWVERKHGPMSGSLTVRMPHGFELKPVVTQSFTLSSSAEKEFAVDHQMVRLRDLTKEAAESRADALEAAIQRFRDCGVDLDRMEIQERPGGVETVLCVDGVPRFTWRLVLNIGGGREQ